MFKLFKRFLTWINPFTDTGLLERLQKENLELDAANRHQSDQAILHIVKIENLKLRIAELDEINTRQKAANDILNIRITHLETKNNETINDLKDALANKEKAFNALYEDANKSKPIIAAQLARIMELNKQIQTLQTANDNLAQKAYMADEAVKNTEVILTDWRRIKQKLIEEGIVKEDVKTTLSKPIRVWFTAYGTRINQHIKANEELKQEINHLKAENEVLKVESYFTDLHLVNRLYENIVNKMDYTHHYNQYKNKTKLNEEIRQFDVKSLKTIVQVNNMTQQVQDNTYYYWSKQYTRYDYRLI